MTQRTGKTQQIRLILAIAERFGVVVSEEVAAKVVSAIGAVAGAIVNYAFMDHFQAMARGHFIVKRLEAKYGTAAVVRIGSSGFRLQNLERRTGSGGRHNGLQEG